jgi:hypothetical protein
MSGRSKILPVDYYTQPSGNSCQSTCLKMMASYIEGGGASASGGEAQLNPVNIYEAVNGAADRPDKANTNSHRNLIWWLQNRFPNLKFKEVITKDEAMALEAIVNLIDRDSPVMVGVSHARVPGHIILVIGYMNYQPYTSTPDFGVVVHDPYGKFDPTLLSDLYGARRYSGGASL